MAWGSPLMEIGQQIIGNGQPLWYFNIAMEKNLNRLIEDLISSNFHITSLTFIS
jgi:hypothetical protein